MYNIIQIKRRLLGQNVSGEIPTLSGGELAYNENSNELYYGHTSGTVTIAGSGSYLKLDGNQTVSGNKTFNNLTTLSSTTFSTNSTINAGSNKIINVADPTSNNDATNKTYVDTVSSALRTAINSLSISSSASTDALSAVVDANFVEKTESDAVTLNGGLTVTNGIEADTLTTTGAVSAHGNATVDGTSTLNGAVTINNTLHATGAVTLDSTLTVAGSAEVGGSLRIVGDLEVLGNFTQLDTTTTTTSAFNITNHGTETALVVDQVGLNTDIVAFKDGGVTALIVKDGGNVGIGTSTPNEKLTVVGNISATGNVNAVNGDLTGTLHAAGATTLDSTLAVTGASTLTGAVSAKSTLTADGATTLKSTLAVTGASTLTGALSAKSTLDVDGATTLNDTLAVTGATTLNNTLTINASTTTTGNLSGSGSSLLVDFVVDGGVF